jgi:CheY-like chemotaxis protein
LFDLVIPDLTMPGMDGAKIDGRLLRTGLCILAQ